MTTRPNPGHDPNADLHAKFSFTTLEEEGVQVLWPTGQCRTDTADYYRLREPIGSNFQTAADVLLRATGYERVTEWNYEWDTGRLTATVRTTARIPDDPNADGIALEETDVSPPGVDGAMFTPGTTVVILRCEQVTGQQSTSGVATTAEADEQLAAMGYRRLRDWGDTGGGVYMVPICPNDTDAQTGTAESPQDAGTDDGFRYGAVLSYVPPASLRDFAEEDVFDSEELARDWAQRQLHDAVTTFGTGWDFRVDIGRITAEDAESGNWGVVDDHVGRAEWDAKTGGVVWPEGPHTFDGYQEHADSPADEVAEEGTR